MTTKREKKTLTSADVRDIAEKLTHFADRYSQLADAMDKAKVEQILAGNFKTLIRSLLFVKKAINAAYQGLDHELLAGGAFEKELGSTKPPDFRPAKAAAEAAKTAAEKHGAKKAKGTK